MKAAVRTLAVVIADGKRFTSNNTLTLAGTDGSTLNIGAGGTLGTGAFADSVPLDSPAFSGVPTAPTAAPGTNTTQLATTAFAKAAVDLAVTGLLDLKGDTDASANPNYPAASKGDAYYITVAGKVGGASGKSVEIGDTIIAKADNAGGTEASVGTSWFVLEHNLAGALVTANNLSELTATASTARTNLGLGTLATQNGTFSGTSSGTNTGDQSSIAGITGTTAQFNTALTDGDFATGGGTATGTNTGDQTTISGNAGSATILQTGRTIAISGDLTYTSPSFNGSGNVTAAGTLATVNSNVGSFGSSTAIPTFTVNGKGLITAAATAVVVAPAGTLSGATLAANVLASSLTSVGTLTGGATGAGFTIAFSTSTLTGTVPPARLGTGSGGATKFLREDSTWQTVSGSGDVVGPASAVADNVAFYDGTTGKLLKDLGMKLTSTPGNWGVGTAPTQESGYGTTLHVKGAALTGAWVEATGIRKWGMLAANDAFLFNNFTAGTNPFTISGTTGAAVFSNDVTATGQFLGKGTVRYEADYTTLEASTPAYTGQLAITPDGRYFFVSYGTTANDWTRLFVVNSRIGQNFPITFNENKTQFADADVEMLGSGKLTVSRGIQWGYDESVGYAMRAFSNSAGQGCGIFWNRAINGFSGFDCLEYASNGTDGTAGGFTFARGGPQAYGGNSQNTNFIESFFGLNGNQTGLASNILITLYGDYGAGTPQRYVRQKFHSNGDISFFKLVGTAIQEGGGAAMFIGADGRVVIGGTTPATGAILTINGAIALGGTSIYSESSPTTAAPVGYGVVGISSTGILRRFEVGVQVGGSASNPGEPVSRVGTAVDLKSADAIGLRISDSASGIVSPLITNAGSGYHTPPAVTVPAAPSGGITAIATAYLTETSLHQTAANITALTGGTGYTASQVVTVTFAAPSNTTGRAGRGTLTANGSGVIAAATAVVFGTAGTGTAVTNSAGVITSVVLSTGGSAFPRSETALPVSFVASSNRTGGGTAATDSSGVITSLVLLAGGTGYTASQGALAITIDAFGAKYGSLPAVTVTPPASGITPRVVAKLNPTTIAQILVSDPGDKYTAGGSFTIDNTGTGGSSGAATYSVVAPITGRGVYEYRMLLVGAGYNPNSPPAVTVVAPPSGTTATGTATVNARGQVTNITAVIPGGAYGLVPAVTVAAPAPVTATGTATQSGGAINSVTITQGGSGYFAAFPAITVGGTGTLGTAVVTAVTGGVVTAIQVTNGGSGYTGTPTITFAAPAAGTTATATAVLGGRAMHIEPDGGEVLIETQLSANYLDEICGKEWVWQNLPNAVTVAAFGITALTETGTVSAVADADGYWKQFANSTINIVNGVTSTTFAIARRDHFPVMTAYIKIGAAITNSRTWFAWTSAILSGKDVPTTEHVCGFRYASVTDTTAFWRVVTAAGSTPTTITTPFPIAINTVYKLVIDMSTVGLARFYINGQLAAQVDTTLPTSSTDLGVNCSTTNVTGTAHELKISYIKGKTRA